VDILAQRYGWGLPQIDRLGLDEVQMIFRAIEKQMDEMNRQIEKGGGATDVW
jgi:hypothetical protein